MARRSAARKAAATHLALIRELTRKGDCGRASYWLRKLDTEPRFRRLRGQTMARAWRLVDRCYIKGRGGHV